MVSEAHVRRIPVWKAACVVVLMLLTSGCERTVLAFVNQGVPEARQHETYSPEKNLGLDIYQPTGKAAGPAPVVVFFYGGAWQRGSAAQYRFVGQRLAEQGWLAIVADYRTWPRVGFPGFVEDGAEAVAWAQKNAARLGGDPQRIYLMGHSAGAQIAVLLGTDARYLARHQIKPSSLAGVIGLAGPYDFNITGQYVPIFGPPSQWPDAMALNFVDGDEPRFLLIHGDEDKVVWPRNSEGLAARLRANGIQATVLIMPGDGHAAPLLSLYRPKSRPQVIAAIKEFIAR